MKAIFKNIGLIREAEIELEGITVVAAPNDSGKSTISKTLYMFLETIANFSEEYTSFRNDSIEEEVKKLSIWFNRTLSESEMQGISNKFNEISDDSTILVVRFNDITYSLDIDFFLFDDNEDERFEQEFKKLRYIYNDIVEVKNDKVLEIFDDIIKYFSFSDIEKINFILKSKIESYFAGDLVSHWSQDRAKVQIIDSKSEQYRSIVQTDFYN
ncbi:TPA: hypothetical protein U1C15_001002, partial [Streptococcus suis]|nr:hypothetical protein [Streptococcus suis]